MKILAILLLGHVFSVTADSLNASAPSIPETEKTLLQEVPDRDKRTLGIDKNIKKEIELKTKLGTILKISKSISYNDGGGLKLLPAILDSLAMKKSRVLDKLHNKSYHHHHKPKVAHRENAETSSDIVSSALNETKPVVESKSVLANQTKGHRHGHLNKHKKLLKLKKNLLMKKISNIVRLIASHKKVGAPCCPTGPCCPGKQG